ncbi:DUF6468 domain-containing protein [Brevundimonas aveniformis]|uniref:DUF6468 domain-containing protein n=1 Tax=Brevundimonas aveniformis TaxID=370977 RepID=UPI000421E810|nr:DUF6468 domain-containing protein [Brevundimonas aveniformis]
MSAVGLIMDVLLISLILAAMAYGLRLEKRLRALREGQDGFVKAVAELNIAAGRAEAALAELRAAGEETDLLHERIVAARTLKADLENLVSRGRSAPATPAPAPVVTMTREATVTPIQPSISTERLLQALAERRAEDLPLTEAARPAPTRRALPEDDLFEAPARRRA